MENIKQNNITDTLIKIIIGLSAITCSLLAFNVVSQELNSKTPDELRYEKVKANFVASLYRGQEICSRYNKANDDNKDCDTPSEKEKQGELDSCLAFNSEQYCRYILADAYKEFDTQVKESKANGTYKISSSPDLEFIDRIKIPKAPQWVIDQDQSN